MMATGVASPSAHGQAITSTAMALAIANVNGCPVTSHTSSVKIAIPMTTGTNTPATLSAIRAIGAFVAAASDTI